MPIATVIALIGQAWARDADGNLRELSVGDILMEGETLVTADNARVELDFGDGIDPTVIGGGQQIVMTLDLNADQDVAAEDFSGQDEDLEALLAALEDDDVDLLDIFDATAAGAGGAAGGGGGGSDFVQLARITEATDPLAYDYGLNTFEGPPESPEGGTPVEEAVEDAGVEIFGLTPEAGDADVTLDEANLFEGEGSVTQSGTFSISAPDGVANLSVGGTTVISNNVFTAQTITTPLGNTLEITSFDPATGVVGYSYTLNDSEDHPTGDGENSLFEDFVVSLTDTDGDSTTGTLTVDIIDDVPAAADDPDASIAEDTTTALTGDVLANDTLGADRPEGVAFDDTQASYGTFTDNGDGTWIYSLDNTNATVQGLSDGETLTETFAYTLTDADGDTSTANLTVTITGQDDGVTLTGLSAEGAEQTVFEAKLPAGSDSDAAALTQSGTFSFVALDELGSLSVGGQSLSLADLQGLSVATPVTLTSPNGTLLLTGFSGDAAGGTLSYSYTLDTTVDNDTVADATGNEYLDSFAVSVVDADGSSATASLDIQIVDDVPNAVDDPDASIAEDTTTALTGDVLANDTLGADRPEGVAFDDTQASYGTFTDNGDGTWIYSLDNTNATVQGLSDGETLTETFAYTLTDADGDTSTANLTITITGTNDGPTIGDVADFGFTEAVDASAQDLSDSGTVTFDDIDTNDVVDISTSLKTGATWSGGTIDPTLATALEAGFSASVTDAAAPGSTGWSYSANDLDLDFLSTGETITLTYTLTATDSQGATATDDVTITITGTNDGPTIGDVADFGFTEAVDASAQDLSDSGTVTFDDIDTNDVVDISTSLKTGATWSGGTIDPTLATALEAGFSASVTDAAAPGSTGWSYSANDLDLDFLSTGEIITLTYTLTATDSQGATATDDVTITITGTNDGPTIGDVADFGFTEAVDASAQDLSDSGTVTFDDIDTNDVVDISTSLKTGATWSGGTIDPTLATALEAGFSASVTDAAAPGSTGWSYSANDLDLDFLSTGETITLTYTLTATDSQGATATDDVTITITGTNDGPTIGDVADFGFTEAVDASAQDLSDSGTVTFDDIDTNDVVDISTSLKTGATWSGGTIDPTLATALEAGFSASVTDAAAPGSTGWSYSANDLDLDFLSTGETITLTYTLTATDSQGATATDDVTITITGTNDGPTIGDVADFGFTEAVDASAQDLSDSGTVTFDDIDTNDVVDISTSLKTGATWSGGTIDPTLATALEAGFSASVTDAAAPGSTGWSYSANDLDLDFLSTGETITLTYTLTATDSQGATATDDVTITITGTNDAPIVQADTNWAFDATETDSSNSIATGNVLTDTVHLGAPEGSFADKADSDADSSDTINVVRVAGDEGIFNVASGSTLTSDSTNLDGVYGTLTIAADGSYSYAVDQENSDVNALNVGDDPLQDTFTYTVSDGGVEVSTTLTLSVFGRDDPPQYSPLIDVWVPLDITELSPEYGLGYPLAIEITDPDSSFNVVITSALPDTDGDIDGRVVYYDAGGNAVDVSDNEVFSYDTMPQLYYLPPTNVDLNSTFLDQVSYDIQEVGTGDSLGSGSLNIWAVPPTAVFGPVAQVGDGSSPLTSGNDQVAQVVFDESFVTAVNNDPSESSLKIFTDFQESPFTVPIDAGSQDGAELESEVQARLSINGENFIITNPGPDDDTWNYDSVTGLMMAEISFSDIYMAFDDDPKANKEDWQIDENVGGTGSRLSLADYLSANLMTNTDTWTVIYNDTQGGNHQARFVRFEFVTSTEGDPSITVVGTANVENFIFGSEDGDDTLTGANLGDTIIGRSGDDILSGLDGDDILIGGSGNDDIDGGEGDDTIIGGPGADSIDGGAGSDTASYQDSAAAVNIDLQAGTASGGDAEGDSLNNIENIIGSDSNDVITGDDNANVLRGGAGDDTLAGGLGADTFVWNLNDQGTSTEPAEDTVTDLFSSEGDVLDLADLLQGETEATIGDFIFAEEDAGNVVLHISSDGSLAGNTDNADQKITLEGKTFADFGVSGPGSDAELSADLIQQMIDSGQLNIDQ